MKGPGPFGRRGVAQRLANRCREHAGEAARIDGTEGIAGTRCVLGAATRASPATRIRIAPRASGA